MSWVSSDRGKGCRVRMNSCGWCALAALLSGLGAARGFAQCAEQQKLTASDAAALNKFGNSVSVSGDTAVVGAPFDACAAGADCGSVYVFRFNGTSWIQEQKLTASDAAAGDRFGWSVAVSGDAAVVGTPDDGCVAGFFCGSAYVFRFNGTSWVEEQKLTASDATGGVGFGVSVSINGDTAVVGESLDTCAAGTRCGSAYVFRFNGTSWVEEQKLTASDPAERDNFGVSVSVRGDTALVGAYLHDCAADADCGSAYVFRFNGTRWVEEQELTASDAGADEWLGWSVSLSGNTAVLGARLDNCPAGGTQCGSAYVFRFNGTGWVEEQKLTASDASALDNFGMSVSVSGNTAVVGALGGDCAVGFAFNCGSAYMFRFNGTSWIEEQKLTASDAAQEAVFGRSVAMSGDRIVVGARGDGCAAGADCGAAYVFHCPPPGPFNIPAISTWGLATVTLLLLVAGTIVIRRTVSSSGSA